MKTYSIEVRLKENSHRIIIGYRILPRLGKYLSSLAIGNDAVVITTPVVNKFHGKSVCDALKKSGFSVKVFEIPDGEKSKSLKEAEKLFNRISRDDVRKKNFIVALGGGVVGDLSGFVASCYKRGIPYVQIPTTLLAQIDSAIGGKVAVDLATGKNLIGAFYQPKLIFSDVSVLETLSSRQIQNGLAEAIKYGVICDKSFFEYLEKNSQNILSLVPESLMKVVGVCSRIKAEIVEKDEKETKGLRTILNFGHTLGHAIEAAGRYNQYQHGEAIAIGMGIAADISIAVGLLKIEDSARLKNLIQSVGLPIRFQNVSLSKILNAMMRDKKFAGKKNRFVLATSIGRVKVLEGVDSNIIRAAILQAQKKK